MSIFFCSFFLKVHNIRSCPKTRNSQRTLTLSSLWGIIIQSLQWLVINLLRDNLFHGNEPLTNLSDKINPQFLDTWLSLYAWLLFLPWYFISIWSHIKKEKISTLIWHFFEKSNCFSYEYRFKICFSVSFWICIVLLQLSRSGDVLGTSVYLLLLSSKQNTVLYVPDLLFTSETGCKMELAIWACL